MNIFESNLQPMRYFVMKAMDKLAQWEQGIPEGLSTGFKSLDPYLMLEPDTYTIIAARPSMGKTALGMQIIRNVAQNLKRANDNGVCTVFSAEMSGRQLAIRMAAEMCGVNSHSLRLGKGKPEDFVKVRLQMEEIESLPIWIDDGSAPSTKIMLQRLDELNKDMPVRCMLFDFVELGGDEAGTEELRVASIHKSLKAIAKTLHIPVIGLCQVSRDVEKTTSKIPQMQHLRYSGMAEQVMDKGVTLMRPEYYIERGETVSDVPIGSEKGTSFANVIKFRDGPVGGVWMAYQKEFARFGDLSRERVEL